MLSEIKRREEMVSEVGHNDGFTLIVWRDSTLPSVGFAFQEENASYFLAMVSTHASGSV